MQQVLKEEDFMVRRVSLLCALTLFMLCASAFAAEGKLSAYLFGDYSYAAQSNDPDFDGKSGFVIRRIYVTYDSKIDDDFTARVRLEMNQSDFTKSASKLTPSVKDAYLKWKLDRHTLYFGLSETPTWSTVEHFWGYRWLEKTPLDLFKYGSSRDIGFAAKGALDREKKVAYHAMIAHGNGNKSENDKGKKAYGSLLFKPTEKAMFEVYGDFEDSEGDKSNTASYVLQGFVGFTGDFGRVGLLYAYASRETAADTNITQNILSGFLVAKLSEKAKAVLRADYLTDVDPNAGKISYIPMVATSENLLFLLGGIDFSMAQNVHFQPNLEVVVYGNDVATGVKPDAEVIPRLSVFFKF